MTSAALRGGAVDHAPIREVVERIVAAWSPDQIWLFGSRARGTSTAESDWDLLVVVPDVIDESTMDPVSAWRLAKGCEVRVEIVPCRASDFIEDRTTPNTLAFEAATRGRLLYER